MAIWPKLLTQHFFKSLAFIGANQVMEQRMQERSAKMVWGRRNDGEQVLKYAKIICICDIYINFHQVYGYLFISVFRYIRKKNT